jgi:hypothetical protein
MHTPVLGWSRGVLPHAPSVRASQQSVLISRRVSRYGNVGLSARTRGQPCLASKARKSANAKDRPPPPPVPSDEELEEAVEEAVNEAIEEVEEMAGEHCPQQRCMVGCVMSQLDSGKVPLVSKRWKLMLHMSYLDEV